MGRVTSFWKYSIVMVGFILINIYLHIFVISNEHSGRLNKLMNFDERTMLNFVSKKCNNSGGNLNTHLKYETIVSGPKSIQAAIPVATTNLINISRANDNTIWMDNHIPQHVKRTNFIEKIKLSFANNRTVVNTLYLKKISGITNEKNEEEDRPIHQVSETGMGKFQEIDEQRDYVYSSFYDDIGDPIIRVIALMQRKHLKQHLLCLLWYNNTISEKVVSRVYVIPESHYGYRYRSALILCPLKAEQKPEYITITRDVTFTLTNKLKVVYPGVRIYNITKCYPALHPNFGDKQQILENIETSSAIEDKHFVFYIQTVNIDVETLLGKYEEIGVVNVYKWQLPVDSHDIHYYGQLACIHDCLYRYLNSSRWILFADLDEIVVPILTKIFPNPVSDVIFRQGNISTNCRSFMFLNAFIPTFFPDTNLVFPWKAVAKSIGLKYILKTKRGAILGSGQRSKVLVNPRGVEIMSIHVVSVFRYNYTGCVIPPTKALLHHYRSSDPNDLTLRGPFKEILDLQLFADLIISKYLKAKKKY